MSRLERTLQESSGEVSQTGLKETGLYTTHHYKYVLNLKPALSDVSNLHACSLASQMEDMSREEKDL